ncbi:protocadherin Fat 1, partial [Aplysia californica]|uniref:Protocadherin Fat 1 n=1 Tax=Aplysia californica TaxID=6500 RepID=A0ABM0JEH7_APLCA
MKQRGAPPLLQWVVAVWLCVVTSPLALGQSTATGGSASALTEDNFAFTLPTYNGTIYENTIGKAYVQTPQRMGILLKRPSSIDMEYTIVGGDPRGVFKAETTTVKDFCFLRIRTQTVNYGMLNRELNSMFHLRVKARGSYPGDIVLESFSNVVVTVLDQNEFSPLFSSVPYDVSIPEDTPLHQSIGQVKASDADVGINGEIYYSFVQATLMFAIHPATGVISLSRPVRYAGRKKYELDILAQDRGITSPGRSSSPNSFTKFTVNILPVNYHPPSIKVDSHDSLIEHGNIGSVFAVLTISDQDIGPNGNIGGVAIERDTLGFFNLIADNSNGLYNLVVVTSVDREAMPENYNVTVIAVDKGTPPKTSTSTIPVPVVDINDNEPEFEHNVYEVQLSEIAPGNSFVVIVQATDKDIGSNAEVRYSIVDGNERLLFSIDPLSGLILTSGRLDAERDLKITLVVQAQDQANSGSRKTGQARVIIDVKDFNDNAPIFNLAQDYVDVRENLPKGAEVLTVTASDEDSGDNGKLSYSIVNSDRVPFHIDAFTGVITTAEVLDFETMRRKYELHLRVSDWGTPFKREEDMVLTVRVQDVNDNSPEFEKIKCSGYLSRESPQKLEVLVLTAIDFDSGNIITYSITEGNDDDCFSIVPSTGSISVNCDMSRYHDGPRVLTVVASDGQHVSTPTTVELTLVNNKRNPSLAMDDVRVSCETTDVASRLQEQIQKSKEANADTQSLVLDRRPKTRNHQPTIAKTFSDYYEVSEKAAVGSIVMSLAPSVTDIDTGYDGQLVYVIADGDDTHGHFNLETFTGKLTVLSPLDHETKSAYRLKLTVSDLGQPQLTATIEVRIAVLDENDNAPVFEKSFYSRKVNEKTMVNSTVLQVTASDVDTGDNGDVRYSIVSDDQDFFIDPHHGVIKVKRALDRELRPYQALVVQASDSGHSVRLSSTTVVNITITDVNDNRPVFVPKDYLVRVREDLPVGAVISTLTAHDLDEGANGHVTYSFTDGLHPNFEVDALTGSVRITRKLDYETQQVYVISGLAEDGGEPSLSSTCLLTIEVMDVNENLFAPEFPDFIARGYVAENLPIGSYVMHVQAEDYDESSSGVGQVFYTIQDGTGLGRFTIDVNGTIRTSQVLDTETTAHYWLTVYAQDRALVPRTARLEVLIEVEDVNDNIPQSLEPAYYASVEENSRVVKRVVQVKATDGDYTGTQASQPLKFSITSGNPQNFFHIDPDTGVISTTSRILDREKQEEHALEVTISDRGLPPLSSTTRVVIKVIDENDNKPVFLRIQRITVFATEHTGEDIFIYRALAFDA